MLTQKAEQRRTRYFARFAQRPAACFVDQIVSIVQEALHDSKRIVDVATPDEREGRNDGDSPFPYVFRFGELVEDAARARYQILAQYVWRGRVDKIPVIDASGVFEVKTDDLLTLNTVCLFKLSDQKLERCQAELVKRGSEENGYVFQRKMAISKSDPPGVWDFQA